jgi:hypothetical protein
MKKGTVDVCKGFYQEARSKQKHALDYLTEQVNPGEDVVEKNASLLKERFSAVPGTPFDRHLDQMAYRLTGIQQEMRAHGMHGQQTVEQAFFSSANPSTTQGIFPAFLASQLIVGALATSLVPHLVAADVPTNNLVAEKVKMTEVAADRRLLHTGEGANLPKTTISRSEGSISLQKYGRLFEASYESISMMTLDVVTMFLQRMGAQVGIDETDDLIETAVAGDGTSSSAVTDTDAEVSGTMDYDELVRLFLAFAIGYQMRHAVINDTNLRTVLNMSEFKDPMAGFRFTRDGVLPGPMGAMWHRWTSTGAASFSTDRILAFDERAGIVRYTKGDMLEEADQIIERQVHQRTMSYWAGFMVWDTGAIQCLDITT